MTKVAIIAEVPYQEMDRRRGGVRTANSNLIQALGKRDDIQIEVLSPCLWVRSTEMRAFGNVQVRFWPKPRRDALTGFRGLKRATQALVSDFRPDVLHAIASPSYIYLATASALPSLVTIHGILRNEIPVATSKGRFNGRFRDFATIMLEKRNLSRIENLIAITPEIESLVKASSPNVRIFRIDNPIDERFFKVKDEQTKPVILFLAWVAYRKGLHVLLEAVRALAPSFPDLEVHVAGLEDIDPDYGPSLREKYSDLVSANRVSFLGGINPDGELARCTLLCLPSLAESAPMVIAEAMAAGKPVVASRVGGVPAMIEDGVTGLLVEPGDARGLERALRSLLLDRKRCAEMGGRARIAANERYAPDSVAQKTVEAYHQVAQLS